MPWTLGKTPDSYELPRLVITSTGTPWLADAAVSSLTLDRELVSSVIPGNIRSDNGLSVGAAQAKVGFATGRAVPWSRDRTRRVETGAPARLLARDSAGNEKDLGAWLIDPASGSLDNGEVSVDLIEPQSAAKKVVQRLPAYGQPPFLAASPLDPIWAIARLAEQVGYNATPRPIAGSSILSIPLDGAIAHYDQEPAGSYTVVGNVPGWVTMPDGSIGTQNGLSAVLVSASSPAVFSEIFKSGSSVFLTLNLSGTVYLHDAFQGMALRVINEGGSASVAVSNSYGTHVNPKAFAPGLSADWPNRVQVEIRRTWDPVGNQWTETRARARSGPFAPWSDYSVSGTSYAPAGAAELMELAAGYASASSPTPPSPSAGSIGAVQFSKTADVALFQQRRALLKPLGGDAGLPWLPPDADVWTGIRDGLSSRAASAVIDPDGSGGSILRVLNRDDLAGVGIAGEPVDLGAEWDDLPWTLDPDDAADRLQVTYSVPQVAAATIGSNILAPAAWEASEVIRVNGGETIVVNAAFDGRAAVRMFSTFITPTTPTALWSTRSTVIAFTSPDGTGSLLQPDQFGVFARQTSATTATITITNRTAAPMYLVDGNGNPHLVLRAESVATFDTQQSVSRGLSVETAVNPLELDLSPWVQSKKDADSVADYLWSRISGGGLWSASSVECRLDWSHNLGRILRVTHPGSGLDFKMLVSKVALSADNGEISQSLDLVVLPWTWADFDGVWSASTWSAFDAVWSSSTWSYFDTDPLKNGA